MAFSVHLLFGTDIHRRKRRIAPPITKLTIPQRLTTRHHFGSGTPHTPSNIMQCLYFPCLLLLITTASMASALSMPTGAGGEAPAREPDHDKVFEERVLGAIKSRPRVSASASVKGYLEVAKKPSPGFVSTITTLQKRLPLPQRGHGNLAVRVGPKDSTRRVATNAPTLTSQGTFTDDVPPTQLNAGASITRHVPFDAATQRVCTFAMTPGETAVPLRHCQLQLPCAAVLTKTLRVLLTTDACFATDAASFSSLKAELQFKLADGRMKFLALAILGGTFTASVGYVDSNWNPTNDGAYTVDCTAFQYVFPVAMEGVEVVATIVNSGSSAKGIMFRATAYNVTVEQNTDVTGFQVFSGPVYHYQFNAGDPKMFFDATGGAGSSLFSTDDFASIYINTGQAPGPLDDVRGYEAVSDGCSSYTGTSDAVLYFQLFFSDTFDSSVNKAVVTTVKVSPHDCSSSSLLKTIGIIAGSVVGVCAVIAGAVAIGYFMRRQESRGLTSRMTGNGGGAVESTNPLGGVELSTARGSSAPPALPVSPCPPAPPASTSGASKTIQIQIN